VRGRDEKERRSVGGSKREKRRGKRKRESISHNFIPSKFTSIGK
jgi:hypothetical protein